MSKYGPYMENKELARRMEEADLKVAKLYPWWKLLWWRITDKKQFKFAIHERLFGGLDPYGLE